MSHPTAFGRWLSTQSGTDTEKAAKLRMSQQRLSTYKLGRRMPRAQELRRLMRLTGLGAEAFIPKTKARTA